MQGRLSVSRDIVRVAAPATRRRVANRSVLHLVVVLALLASVAVLGPGSVSPASASEVLPQHRTEPSAFTSIDPCRLLDTRTEPRRARVPAGRSIDVVARERCEVPRTATIVAVTVTAVDPSGPGFLTAYPTGNAVPNASVVNYGPGDVIASQQYVPIGDADSISVFSLAATHLVVDVAGFFEPAGGATTAGRFVPVTQRRLIDTRATGRPSPGDTLRLDPGLSDEAAAVVVNITTTATLQRGYFSAFPAGSGATDTSVLNVDRRDQSRAAGAVVRLAGGEFDVFTSGGDHVIVDLVGYFTSDAAPSSNDGLFVGATARRLVDTRLPAGDAGGPRLWDRGGREFDLTDIVGPQVSAIAASIAVTRTEAPGFAILHPAGRSRPETSTVNYDRGQQTVANSTIVRVSERGIALWALEATHAVVDVSGWFTGEPVSAPEPVVRNDPPPDRRVTIISDSAMAGVRWNGALAGFQGFVPVALLESCRRLATPSCRGREGFAPRSTVAEIDRLPPAGPEEMLVVATGYNDWHEGFGAAFDAVVDAARRRGFRHIAWVDYRSDVGYRLPGSGGTRSNYGAMNEILADKLGSGAYPDVRRWHFDHFTAGTPSWFASDGVHETRLGSWGVADWVSRHVRAFDDRPCAQPWTAGGPIETPCPDPDVVVRDRGVPDIAALYPAAG